MSESFYGGQAGTPEPGLTCSSEEDVVLEVLERFFGSNTVYTYRSEDGILVDYEIVNQLRVFRGRFEKPAIVETDIEKLNRMILVYQEDRKKLLETQEKLSKQVEDLKKELVQSWLYNNKKQ